VTVSRQFSDFIPYILNHHEVTRQTSTPHPCGEDPITSYVALRLCHPA